MHIYLRNETKAIVFAEVELSQRTALSFNSILAWIYLKIRLIATGNISKTFTSIRIFDALMSEYKEHPEIKH